MGLAHRAHGERRADGRGVDVDGRGDRLKKFSDWGWKIVGAGRSRFVKKHPQALHEQHDSGRKCAARQQTWPAHRKRRQIQQQSGDQQNRNRAVSSGGKKRHGSQHENSDKRLGGSRQSLKGAAEQDRAGDDQNREGEIVGLGVIFEPKQPRAAQQRQSQPKADHCPPPALL